jgi:hypothetical protein
MEFKYKIANHFFECYSQTYVDDLNDFKMKHIKKTYEVSQPPFTQEDHLKFFLGKIMENTDMVDCASFDFNNKQKVFELGLYFLATEVIYEITQRQCNDYILLTFKQETKRLKEENSLLKQHIVKLKEKVNGEELRTLKTL